MVGKLEKEIGREGSDGKAVQVCIAVWAFLSICFSFSGCLKDMWKLESLASVECFFITFLQLSEIEVVIGVKGVLAVLDT